MKSASLMQDQLKALAGLSIASTLLGCSLYPNVNSDPAKNNTVALQHDAVD